MITIEYNTLDGEGNDVRESQQFTITRDMVADLIRNNIEMNRAIEEDVDEDNLFVLG